MTIFEVVFICITFLGFVIFAIGAKKTYSNKKESPLVIVGGVMAITAIIVWFFIFFVKIESIKLDEVSNLQRKKIELVAKCQAKGYVDGHTLCRINFGGPPELTEICRDVCRDINNEIVDIKKLDISTKK
jgi:hypothetical protein